MSDLVPEPVPDPVPDPVPGPHPDSQPDSQPDSTAFLADILATPDSLRRLADAMATDELPVPAPAERTVLLGMGSSRYAALLPAAVARSRGRDVVAELASAELGTVAGAGTLVVAVSASGGSRETLAAARRHLAGGSRVAALTEATAGPLVALAGTVHPLLAGPEPGGVACRSYAHTAALLLDWVDRWTGAPPSMTATCRRAADALDDLHARADAWLPALAAALDGPDGVAVLAPAERLGTALQGALMVREGPRRPAAGHETGDWSHVDVYLTKTQDDRTLLHAGSSWDGPALDWLRRRGRRWVAVGAAAAGPSGQGCDLVVRYPGDHDLRVALLVETVLLERLAQRWWWAVGG